MLCATALSSGYEAVIVVGGDSTVNEVVNVLVRVIIPAMETDLFQRGAKGWNTLTFY